MKQLNENASVLHKISAGGVEGNKSNPKDSIVDNPVAPHSVSIPDNTQASENDKVADDDENNPPSPTASQADDDDDKYNPSSPTASQADDDDDENNPSSPGSPTASPDDNDENNSSSPTAYPDGSITLHDDQNGTEPPSSQPMEEDASDITHKVDGMCTDDQNTDKEVPPSSSFDTPLDANPKKRTISDTTRNSGMQRFSRLHLFILHSTDDQRLPPNLRQGSRTVDAESGLPRTTERSNRFL